MDFQWIFLALFLVAIISGVPRALKSSMLKNLLRLGAAVLAFLVAFIMQICGVFQGIIETIAEAIDLMSMLPIPSAAVDFIVAMASTLVSPIFVIIVFYILYFIFRIVAHFVAKGIEKNKRTNESEPAEAIAEAIAEESVTLSTENPEEAGATEESSADGDEKSKKSKPCKKFPWKVCVSLASVIVGNLLVLAISLMPLFYLASIFDTVTDAIDGTDAEDSVVYQLVDTFDKDIASPLCDNFVFGFYRATGISGLTNYTVRAGGKILLDSGEVIYADDVLKNLVSHSVSLAAQATSQESEYPCLEEDVTAILTDPMVASVISDVVMELIDGVEIEEPSEDDMIGGLLYDFVDYYKNADYSIIENDLKAIGKAIGALAESGVISDIVSGNMEFEKMLESEDTLAAVVEAISGLSAFGETMQSAFELGVGLLGDALYIPADSSEVYDNFIADLCAAMQTDGSDKYTKFTSSDISRVRNYIRYCAANGGKLQSSTDKDLFLAYVAQWQKIQSAFAYISEDKSYGYFSVQLSDGVTYIYDHQDKIIVAYSDENADIYKNKISPVAGLINVLAERSSTKEKTADWLYTLLQSYSESELAKSDPASLALAKTILDRDSYVTKAATVENMVASVDFINWDAEDRANDSRICASVIIDLLGLMENLESVDSAEGTDIVEDLMDQFSLLGEALDNMNKTSCIGELPHLVVEGLIKSDMLDDYMKPSMAYQMNDLVDKQGKTYAECMNQIVDVLKFALGNLEVEK